MNITTDSDDNDKQNLAQDEDDSDLFQNAMQGVKPLAHDKILLQGPKPSPNKLRPDKPNRFSQGRQTANAFVASDHASMTHPEEILSYATAGVQAKTLKRLKNGQLSCKARLDLHGASIEQAADKLGRLLNQWQTSQSICVLIIHGRGHRSFEKKPIIKQQVNHWLRQDKRILAFHSATPRDGGSGALYVLLRKRQVGNP